MFKDGLSGAIACAVARDAAVAVVLLLQQALAPVHASCPLSVRDAPTGSGCRQPCPRARECCGAITP